MRIFPVALLLFAASTAQAQMAHHHDMSGMSMDPVATAKEIQQVAQAMHALSSEAAAKDAGFHPVFGWIPTMGEHWVNRSLMMSSNQFSMTSPNQLMFSKVAGHDSLVGAAYAYFTAANDTTRPKVFAESPGWHEHANLAPPGMTLVMLHVWFVPSPDGPFAGTNPNLPFWALGLAAPDSARMRDAAFVNNVRRAALALSEVADTNGVFPNLNRRMTTHALLAPHRDSIRTIVADLRASEHRDPAKWDAAIARAAAQWDAMYQEYQDSAITPDGKTRIRQHVSMLLGAHEH